MAKAVKENKVVYLLELTEDEAAVTLALHAKVAGNEYLSNHKAASVRVYNALSNAGVSFSAYSALTVNERGILKFTR